MEPSRRRHIEPVRLQAFIDFIHLRFGFLNKADVEAGRILDFLRPPNFSNVSCISPSSRSWAICCYCRLGRCCEARSIFPRSAGCSGTSLTVKLRWFSFMIFLQLNNSDAFHGNSPYAYSLWQGACQRISYLNSVTYRECHSQACWICPMGWSALGYGRIVCYSREDKRITPSENGGRKEGKKWQTWMRTFFFARRRCACAAVSISKRP